MALTAKIVSCSSPEAFSRVSTNPQKPLLDPRRFFLTEINEQVDVKPENSIIPEHEITVGRRISDHF